MRPLILVLGIAGVVGLGAYATSAVAARSESPAASSAAYAIRSQGGNVYATGVSVVETEPVSGDVAAFGGTLILAAPISGDALAAAGSVRVRTPIGGDVRALGGTIAVDEPVRGDVLALGYAVDIVSRPGGSVLVIAANTRLTGGAAGPVTLYGNNILLMGDFGDDVHIVASGRITVASSTLIHGALSYEAPEPATIAPSARVLGGIVYTNASYLPNIGTSRVLTLINMGFFLLVRFLGALLLAGLLAGLFPKIGDMVVTSVFTRRVRYQLLTTLLGFAIIVVAPILTVLLMLTFIGLGLALLLGLLYLLLILLALLYSGILLGGALARKYARRETILWRDGVLGMLILSLAALIPVVGLVLAFLLACYVAGALLQLFYHFAFSSESVTPELL